MTSPGSPERDPAPAALAQVRRRDVPATTIIWALSNGTLARQLGWAGLLLLPLTYPTHLATVAFGRPQLRRRGRGVCAIQGAVLQRDLPLWTAAFVLQLAWLFVTFTALGLVMPSYLGVVAVVLVVVIDVGGSVIATNLARIRRHHPSLGEAAQHGGGGWWVLTGLACFPRGRKHGTGFMMWLRDALDHAGATAVLDARTDRLVCFYSSFGFRASTDVPRRMIRSPRDVPARDCTVD